MHAMLSGDLDVAYVGVAPPIAAMYEGLDAKIVAGVSPEAVKIELKKTFSEKDAARLANTFRVVQEIRKR